MIKFKTPDLDGYGFDLIADRVVRFNKHPDGTYLNTRATYSINKKQFTHFNLRAQAIQDIQDQPLETRVKQPLHKNHRWIFAAIMMVIISLGECSFEAKSNVTVENTQ